MDDRSRLNLGFNNSPDGRGRTGRRKNLESESRVANNCCGVESAFCNPTVSIESFGYLCNIKFPKKDYDHFAAKDLFNLLYYERKKKLIK